MIKLLKDFAEKKPKLYEIFKFLVVGGFATIIDMLVMALVLYIYRPSLYDYNFINTVIGGASPNKLMATIATGLGFIAGLIFNYFLSIIFVFNRTDTTFAKTRSGFLVFSLLSMIGFLIHTIGMAVGYGLLGINEWVIKVVLTFVVLIFNYITRKKIIFKKARVEN